MLTIDQVATAPCTDGIQVRHRTFEAKPCHTSNQILGNTKGGHGGPPLQFVCEILKCL